MQLPGCDAYTLIEACFRICPIRKASLTKHELPTLGLALQDRQGLGRQWHGMVAPIFHAMRRECDLLVGEI
jgi:hypothetical protein